MKTILSRLERLEAIQPSHLILEIVINGEVKRMTAKEFVAAGYDFFSARIVAGNSLEDVDLLLSTIPSCIQ